VGISENVRPKKWGAPRFPNDDGSLSDSLAAALAVYQKDSTTLPELYATLQQSRLLVPIVATGVQHDHGDNGLVKEKSSEMVAVLLTNSAGETAALAFTHLAALDHWATLTGQHTARPVAALSHEVAQQAVEQGASALVINSGSDHQIVVDAVDLQGIAGRWQLLRVGNQLGWIRPVEEPEL
jgi:hypothetical protein